MWVDTSFSYTGLVCRNAYLQIAFQRHTEVKLCLCLCIKLLSESQYRGGGGFVWFGCVCLLGGQWLDETSCQLDHRSGGSPRLKV